jgi:site-specific DNA recombinase
MSTPQWRPAGRKPRAISLTRVSSDPRFESTSHDTQHAANLRCIADLGAELFAHYEETVSGALYQARKETQRALEDLEADRADYLILFSMDRYGRSVRWQQEILARVERAEKRIQFAQFRLEYDDETNRLTPMSRAAFNNFGTMSELERYSILERTQRGVKRQLELGKMPKRSRSAFGYRIVQKKDIVREEQPAELEGKYILGPPIEQEAARALFEQFARLQSVNDVTAWLRENYPPEKCGRVWVRTTVHNMLRNPIYAGNATFGKTRRTVDESRRAIGLGDVQKRRRPKELWKYVDAPPLVSAELWNECQTVLDENKIKRAGRPSRRYALSGLLACPHCGFRMGGISMKGREYYRCLGRYRSPLHKASAARCTFDHYLRAADIEALLFAQIYAALDNPDLLNAAREIAQRGESSFKSKPQTDKAKMQKELTALEKRERAIAEQIVEARVGKQSTAVFQKMLDELDARRSELQALLKTEAAPAAPPPRVASADAATLRTVLQSGDVPAFKKNALLHSIIENVTPTARGKKVTIAWRR